MADPGMGGRTTDEALYGLGFKHLTDDGATAPQSLLFSSAWEILGVLYEEHGDGGIEIWRGEDGFANIDVDTERGTGNTLGSAILDVVVKLVPNNDDSAAVVSEKDPRA